jgi:small-conductance mechanosensitive channel
MKLLDRFLSNNSIETLGIALAITLIVLIVLYLIKVIAVSRIKRIAERSKTRIDDLIVEVIATTKIWLLIPLAFYIGASVLEIPPKIERVLSSATTIALLLQVAVWGNQLIAGWLSQTLKQKMQQDAAAATTLSVAGFISRLALWSVVVLLTLGNLGFDITGLVAGLGIGGIAVALAAQNILGDLFASLSIVLDKPFLIGDFIIVDEKPGTVEYIGLKTTRIRSLGGEQLVFSNAEMVKLPIRNYKRMRERRIVFVLGVTYQTPAEKLERIPAIIREIIESQEKSRFDRAHFKEYGDFALIFEVVHYILGPEYNVYMDVQEAINFAIFRRFEAEGIEFAYPTQTLHVQNLPALPS